MAPTETTNGTLHLRDGRGDGSLRRSLSHSSADKGVLSSASASTLAFASAKSPPTGIIVGHTFSGHCSHPLRILFSSTSCPFFRFHSAKDGWISGISVARQTECRRFGRWSWHCSRHCHALHWTGALMGLFVHFSPLEARLQLGPGLDIVSPEPVRMVHQSRQ